MIHHKLAWALLSFVATVCITQGETISNADYSVKIDQGVAKVTLIKTGKSKEIPGVRVGEFKNREIAHSGLLGRTTLLLPMEGYFYKLINLKDFLDSSEPDTPETVIRIEGGTLRTRFFDRRPVYWSLDKMITDDVISGQSADETDTSFQFFIDLEHRVIVTKNDDARKKMTCRTESETGDQEQGFEFIVDADRYQQLTNLSTN